VSGHVAEVAIGYRLRHLIVPVADRLPDPLGMLAALTALSQ